MRFVCLLALISLSSFGFSQSQICSKDCSFKNGVCVHPGNNLKTTLSDGQKIKLYPIPVSDDILHVQAVGLEIYSFQVFNAAAEIVEIENLSGRDEPTELDVRSLNPGIYFIIFDTSAGSVTKRFSVI